MIFVKILTNELKQIFKTETSLYLQVRGRLKRGTKCRAHKHDVDCIKRYTVTEVEDEHLRVRGRHG